MITIGYSTRKSNPQYKEYLQKTCMYKEVQIIEKINNGEKSLSEVYNEIIEESNHDIIVLCHDDIEFDTNRWGEKLLKHFNKQPEYGIFGLAGSKYLPDNGQWWFVQQMMFGIVNHKHEGKKWTSSYSKDLNNKVEEVVLVDGLFIAFDKTKIKHKFDETIKGFHFYDLGFSVPNHIDGVKVGVIFDIRVTHLSVGQTNEKWEENRKQFVEKYKSNLPIDINNKDLSQTFIFVHDQDLIISFEKNNKFTNLYNYKYVFLGNRPVDKLESMDNVIIVRNLEYNIEQYPLFTSYTGWYALWKNNLITTKYINLFEYDVVLDNNIEQNHSKFYYMDAEMIGYVPFPVSHYQFIQNPEWNHAIIPSIKKHYKQDIVNHYLTVLKQNPNALWSSTSNTTFRTDVFNEYMKWFQPIVEDIKETKTCGHAHERSISFFSSLKNKKMLLTNNILKHLQLDSHKTQGHFVDQDKQMETLLGVKKSNGRKYLSFSLWGDKPIYNIGAIRNAELRKEIYPDWEMVVYYDNTVPQETITELAKLGVITIDMSSTSLYGMFWRFMATSLPDSEYSIFRDCDSRITIREKMAVDEWINSGKSLHVMRDHPNHGIPYGNDRIGILGGMWGLKSNSVNLTEMINQFPKSTEHNYGNDQTFLRTIYSMFENDKITHDEFFEKKPFPVQREYGRFVGDRIDENNKPVGNDYRLVLQ